ncbi:DNA repair protein rad51c [Mayamaea pseudoterrestris]|nr:DNA repair protein rad51c [Mayamaea pseudoterrestris]
MSEPMQPTQNMSASDDIPLAHLPLRPSTLQTFEKRGFVSWREVHDAKQGGMPSLAEELQVSVSDAASLVREIQNCLETDSKDRVTDESSAIRIGVSAAELLQGFDKNSVSSIITFCRAVDQMLGGGIGLGEMTEVSGLPGTGKTQWGMQLAVDARLPVDFGGVQGETIYIDAEGSFAPERCLMMASSLVKHLSSGLRKRNRHATNLPHWFTSDEILGGIHVFRVHDEATQTAVIYSLPHFIQKQLEESTKDNTHKRAPIKLIVIDSMAFHHRASGPATDYIQRTQSLMRQVSLLASLAFQHNLAVLVINQMTTKVLSNNAISASTDESSRSVPALGESWAHAVSTRLLLQGNGSGPRTCRILKSPRLPNASAEYRVVDAGVRAADYVEKQPQQQRDKGVQSKRAKVT